LALARHGESLVVISGGCKQGADNFAASSCDLMGVNLIEHFPRLSGVRNYGEAVQRYYARNRKIAEDCDILVALVANDRKGGTENTIKYAMQLGKEIVIT